MDEPKEVHVEEPQEKKKLTRKEIQRRYREKNREILNEKNRIYRKEKPEKVRESNRKWVENNRDKVNEKSKRFREKHPEKVKERWGDWYHNNKARVRENKLKRVYGLTLADYEAMLVKQGGRCACCPTTAEEEKNGVLVIDHCHKSGKVRGLLCNACNTAIGLFKEDLDAIGKAIDYLRKHSELTNEIQTGTVVE